MAATSHDLNTLMQRYYQRHDPRAVALAAANTGDAGVFYGPDPLDSLPDGGRVIDGKCLYVAGRRWHSIQLEGDVTTLTGTIEVSLNGKDWRPKVTINGLGLYEWTGVFAFLRLTITASAGGTAWTADYLGQA